jgi:hypothetical protein
LKRLLHIDLAVRATMRQAPPGLRAAITDTLLDLTEDPEPLGAMPYGGIPHAFVIQTGTFRMVYTYGPDHVSIWVSEIDT